MELGIKLRNARIEKGITQEHAAELLCVSRQTISNWENNKSYPDIISVIKMSDIYSVSLDHLLKEGKAMNQTYQEFLEESTNTVKAKKNMEKATVISTYFIAWIVTMFVIWKGNISMTSSFNIIFVWITMPLVTFILSIIIGKNKYWKKGNLFCILLATITFYVVPKTSFIVEQDIATYSVQFPNFTYMVIGFIISSIGVLIGKFFSKKNTN